MRTDKIRTIAAVLFVLSALILLANTINYASAQLNIKSDPYVTEMEMYDIGVSLKENDEIVASRDYAGDGKWNEDAKALLSGVADFRYGQTYDEKLAVVNSGVIDTYVRVTIYRYWLDKDGNKDLSLDPHFIDLQLTDSDLWLKDETYSYDADKGIYNEKICLYYVKPLPGKLNAKDEADRTSELFAQSLTVDGDIKKYYTQKTYEDSEGYTVVENTYAYDGKKFCVDIEVDAVQTHNSADAILSAWGRKVSVDSEGRLTLQPED